MNGRIAQLTLTAACLACLPGPLRAATGGEEQRRLIGVLTSNRPVGEVDAACRRLKQIGRARSVPALAALLTDKEQSHVARYALESMACAEAGEALRAALATTAGRLKAGVIDSLGDRRERKAAGELAKLLGDGDAMIATAAATALGKIGGAKAAAALKAAISSGRPAVRDAAIDALLLCADRLRAEGEAKAASAIYEGLRAPEHRPHVRTAAYRGLVRAGGDGATALVVKGLTGGDRPAELASLQLIREVKGEAATRTFAALLDKVSPRVGVMLLAGLAQRGDSAAVPAVLAALRSGDPAVRIAALDAIRALGDASAVPVLARAAAGARGGERKSARLALARLRGGDVGRAIVEHLPGAAPAVKVELIGALAARREPSAAGALTKLAGDGDASVRAAAIRATGLLAGEEAVAKLLGLLTAASAPADREAIEEALVAIAGRSKRRESLVRPVLAASRTASIPARCALLRVAGRIGGAEALGALRAGVGDGNAAVRDAAIRTLADAAGVEAAGDLLALAREAAEPAQRVLAMRGYWRVVGTAADRPPEQRLKMCAAGLAAAWRPAERKLGLAALAGVPHADALRLAESLCARAAIRPEAEAACVRIAASLASRDPAAAKAALARFRKTAKSPSVRAEAGKALAAIDQYVGYVADWQAAGPYRQKGKECQQLYDVVFGPERPGAAGVKWRPAPHPADASLGWQVDLGPLVGGNHCIMYIRTRVHSPKRRPVKLEIGTDDGIKLWINGKLVHANNAVRGLTPRQDKATANLEEGWNELLAKITQHTLGCGACIRILTADGAPLADIRCDPGQPASQSK